MLMKNLTLFTQLIHTFFQNFLKINLGVYDSYGQFMEIILVENFVYLIWSVREEHFFEGS
jgi:hypothetical protein